MKYITKYNNHLKIVCIICLLLFLCGCTQSMQAYYIEKDNYITASGTLDYIKYNEDGTALYLGFSDMSYDFSDDCFKITDDNLAIAQANGIDSAIAIGAKVDFITAPRYFGDGYVMPIVEISIGEKTYLEFDDGYSNLIDIVSK